MNRSATFVKFGLRNEFVSAMFRSGAARFVTLPINALFGLLLTSYCIQALGVSHFAVYAVATSVIALLPFADLGVGAAVINAVAARPEATDDGLELQRTLAAAFRVLLGVSIIGVSLALVLGASGRLTQLLGSVVPSSAGWPLVVSFSLFAISMPFGLGQRICLGHGRNEVQVLLQSVQPAVAFLFVSILGSLLPTSYWFVSGYFLAYFVCNLITFVISMRWVRNDAKAALKLALSLNALRVKIYSTAGPMLVIMIVLPALLQSHRIILSHTASRGTVAAYSLAAQLMFPVLGVVSAASASLWPLFARERAAWPTGRSYVGRISMVTSAITFVTCAIIVTFGDRVASIISGDGQIHLSNGLLASFAAVILVMAAQGPFGYFLTDRRGLTFQAFWQIPLFVIGLPLIILAALTFGANAMLLSTAIIILCFQLIPVAIKSSRVISSRAAAPNDEAVC